MSKDSNSKLKRGRLKIYLGMSAGVGKTYAMLQDARQELEDGEDIVAGYIEPHGRVETERLVDLFEVIPVKEIFYQGIVLKEFDLQAALERAPRTILVDELAHTNAPGSLHSKRWLDIKTLLDAGINVYSTINIQHLESVSELVSSLTGVTVHETVPDSVLREADSIEVVDIPPDELIDRLKAGKIYQGEKIDSALRNFFKEGSLLALREVLLRKAAEKIDSDVLKYRKAEVIRDSWASSDRMIVAIGPNRFAKRLIRKAGLIAASRRSALTVVYVQTPHLGILPASDQELVDNAIQAAQGMGATIERRYGTDIVAEILKCAVELNASLILVGKPIKNRVRDLIVVSIADDLVRRSGNIDVLLVTGETEEATPRPVLVLETRPRLLSGLYALGVVILCTLLGKAGESHVEIATIAMLYILGAVVIARNSGRTESVISSIVSVLCFNFFFIEPRYTFTVRNTEYLVTFLAMVAVSLSISGLVTRIRLQNLIVAKRERRAIALYEASREINKGETEETILDATHRNIVRLGDIDCGILSVQDQGLKSVVVSNSLFEMQPEEFAVASFVVDKGEPAGLCTDTLPGAGALYLPIKTERTIYGVCALSPLEEGLGTERVDREFIQTIELMLQQSALCLERLSLEKIARATQIKVESEAMRSLILGSVSHDFRTPLTVIEGAAEQIGTAADTPPLTKDLSQLILEHSQRLSRVVNNALSLTKLESDSPKLNLEWECIEEIIGQAIAKYRTKLGNRDIEIDYPDDVPLLRVDGVLLDQLLSNIIENSLSHAKAATKLCFTIEVENEFLRLFISDNGPGVGCQAETYRPRLDTETHSGTGLGVRICDLIARLHGGRFEMTTGDDGGAVVIVELPICLGAGEQMEGDLVV